MYYRDLSFYRDGDEGDDEIAVFLSVKNIGWLDLGSEYSKGSVQPDLILKIREFMFLDLKNDEAKKSGYYKQEEAINIHCMHVRGSPYKCSLCQEPKSVEYSPLELKHYQGVKLMKAGLNEICIPSLNKGEFYSFPTLLLHYIIEHEHCPPKEFLNALAAFDLTKPYDIDDEQEELEVLEVECVDLGKYN